MSAICAVPTSDTIGAVIAGADLSKPLTAEQIERVKAALAAYLVIVFRGQELEPADLLRYSRYFGEPESVQLPGTRRQSQPVAGDIGNGMPDNASGKGESVWHPDLNFTEAPPFSSCLYAVEVSGSGSETEFLSTFDAYDALPSRLKWRIEGLSLKHDATTNSVGALRAGQGAPVDVMNSPGAVHPLVTLDPLTQRKSLFLGRRRNAHVTGLELQESEALLDELWHYVEQCVPTWRHAWRAGDLVHRDNRWTMHRRAPASALHARLTYRTQIRESAANPLQQRRMAAQPRPGSLPTLAASL